jgi:hypothetical protein
MKILRFGVPTLTCIGMLACAGATADPQALAKQLETALSSGNIEAARALADIADAPADLHFYFFDQVRECAAESKCTVSTAPIDDEFRQQMSEQAKQYGAETPTSAEGLIVVNARAVDGSGSGAMKMPYAKVNGQYKLIPLHYSAAQLTALRGKTNEALLQEMFAGGIYDPVSKGRRTDWATAAKPLPADGGDPGAKFRQQTAAMAVAVDAKDPDAAMRSGGMRALRVFADKTYDGKPIALDARKKKLQVQALRMLRDVKVKGGYALGDDAALIIEARNGIGWIERGAVLVSRDGEVWDLAGKQTISYPDR